jgi:large subunit ribosomal protein L25
LKQLELTATLRTDIGNGPARQLRMQGKMPAVLYGPKTEPILLTVDIKELETALKEGSLAQSIFNLSVDGSKKKASAVMIRELQRHPVSGNFLHADFYEIDMKQKIAVMVPVTPVGKSKGVEMGGLLQVIRREIEVLCLPTEIPESFEIDITDMEIGDSLHVDEITTTENVEIPYDVNFTVLTVVSPKIEEEPEEEEEAEVEEGEEGAAEESEEEEAAEE